MVVFSLVLFIGTWEFSEVGGYVSPKMFPRIVATVLFVFSAVLLARSLLEIRRGGANPARLALAALGQWNAVLSRYQSLAVLVGISFAYIYAMETVGYVIATVIYLAVTVVIYGEKRWPLAAAIGVAGGFSLYGLFRLVFQVPLPRFDLF